MLLALPAERIRQRWGGLTRRKTGLGCGWELGFAATGVLPRVVVPEDAAGAAGAARDVGVAFTRRDGHVRAEGGQRVRHSGCAASHGGGVAARQRARHQPERPAGQRCDRPAASAGRGKFHLHFADGGGGGAGGAGRLCGGARRRADGNHPLSSERSCGLGLVWVHIPHTPGRFCQVDAAVRRWCRRPRS